jgi:hypothetical protein
MDAASQAITAIAAIAVWEVGKIILPALLKRRGDQIDAKRRLLREDLDKVQEQVPACLEVALVCFAPDTDDAKRGESARTLRHKVQTLGIALNRVNIGLEVLAIDNLDDSFLISFRRALTMHLDQKPPIAMGSDDPRVTAMYRAGHHLSMSLTKVKYRVT